MTNPQSKPNTIDDPDFVMSTEVQTEYERGVADGIRKREALANEVLERTMAAELENDALRAKVDKLTDKLSFAEFEWNRATDGMKERDKRVDELTAALEPFAKFAPREGSALPDDLVITQGSSLAIRQLTLGDCRRARAAIAMYSQHSDGEAGQ